MTNDLKKEVLVKNLSEVLFLPDNDVFHKMPKSRCMTLDNVVHTYRTSFTESYLNINFNHSSPYIYQNQDTAFINKIYSSLRVLNEDKLNLSRELKTSTEIRINNYDISATYLLDIEKTENQKYYAFGRVPSLFYPHIDIQIIKNFKSNGSESEVILEIIADADKHSSEVNNNNFIISTYICKISKEERLFIAEKLYDLLESYKMSLISEYRLSLEENRIKKQKEIEFDKYRNELEGKELERRFKGYEIALGGEEWVDIYTNDEKERIKNDALRIKEKKDKDKKRKKQKKFARIFLFSFLSFFILILLNIH